MSERTELTDRIEEILRSRTYDRHAYDPETFDELLDEIDETVRELIHAVLQQAAAMDELADLTTNEDVAAGYRLAARSMRTSVRRT